MSIIKKIYGNGQKKILFDWDIFDESAANDICRELDIQLHIFDIYQVLPSLKKNIFGYVMPKEQEKSLSDPIVQKFNEQIKDYVLKNGISHIHVSTFIFHNGFIKELQSLGVEFSTRVTDDPEKSKWYSEPYVKYFDKAICSGVMYDKNITIAEMWRRWGAKSVRFIPTYPEPKHYDDSEPNYSNRDLDIVFVGSVNIARMWRISKFKRHFGKRFHLFGNYGNGDFRSIKGIVYFFLNKILRIGYIKPLTSEELKVVYGRAKIGVNLHINDNKGPSNVRSYELPLNGILQIADNKKGYPQLFLEGEEIVCFESIDEAMGKIEFFLENEPERLRIAKKGYERARSNYTYRNILRKTLEYIIE